MPLGYSGRNADPGQAPLFRHHRLGSAGRYPWRRRNPRSAGALAQRIFRRPASGSKPSHGAQRLIPALRRRPSGRHHLLRPERLSDQRLGPAGLSTKRMELETISDSPPGSAVDRPFARAATWCMLGPPRPLLALGANHVWRSKLQPHGRRRPAKPVVARLSGQCRFCADHPRSHFWLQRSAVEFGQRVLVLHSVPVGRMHRLANLPETVARRDLRDYLLRCNHSS